MRLQNPVELVLSQQIFGFFTNNQFIEIINKKNEKPPTLQIKKRGQIRNSRLYFHIRKIWPENGTFSKRKWKYCNRKSWKFWFWFWTPYKTKWWYYSTIWNGRNSKLKNISMKKVPQHEKSNILLLTQNKEVLWATGLGISDKIKVRTKPTHKLTIEKKRG